MEAATISAVALVIVALVGLVGILLRRNGHAVGNPDGELRDYPASQTGSLAADLWIREFDRIHSALEGLRGDVQDLTAAIRDERLA